MVGTGGRCGRASAGRAESGVLTPRVGQDFRKFGFKFSNFACFCATFAYAVVKKLPVKISCLMLQKNPGQDTRKWQNRVPRAVGRPGLPGPGDSRLHSPRTDTEVGTLQSGTVSVPTFCEKGQRKHGMLSHRQRMHRHAEGPLLYTLEVSERLASPRQQAGVEYIYKCKYFSRARMPAVV